MVPFYEPHKFYQRGANESANPLLQRYLHKNLALKITRNKVLHDCRKIK